jgi:YD repeat-containing protein
MSYDGDGRQVKTVETWVDENFETQSETKYYVRSTVLGGQLLAEVDAYGQFSRTFVYAGPAVLGWLWHSYSGETMNWEQRDPSGATVRGIGEQELDPLGADAGTFATSVPPTERAIVSYGASYNPAHPNFTYSVDGIRVPLEDFIAFAGIKLKDPLGLLEDWARASGKPIGYRNAGVRWGQRYEVIYDANGNLVHETSTYNPTLSTVSFGLESPIYSNTSFDPTLLPQTTPKVKNATAEQQTRFNEAYKDLWDRLHANDGKNACADLFGGIKNAEATLAKTDFRFAADLRDDVNARTTGRQILFNPSSNRALMTPAGSTYDFYLVKVVNSGTTPEGYQKQTMSISSITLSSVTAGAFLLAHELGHRRNIYGATNEDDTFASNGINNFTVWKACFSEVTPVPQEGRVGPRP